MERPQPAIDTAEYERARTDGWRAAGRGDGPLPENANVTESYRRGFNRGVRDWIVKQSQTTQE